MPVIFQCVIQRRDLRANPGLYYIFGDNMVRQGYGGQAAAMRGEPNAVGIPTKRTPDTDETAYFYDHQFEEFCYVVQPSLLYVEKLLIAKQTIIMPMDGIGGGRARLQSQPKIWTWLQEQLNGLGLISPKGYNT